MELRITGRHSKLGTALREYAEGKLAPLSKYDGRARVIEVVLDHEALRTTVEAKAHVGRGAPLVVRAKHATPEGAIDLVHDKLEGALRRNKERVRDRHRAERRRAGEEPAGPPAPAGGPEEE